MVDINSVISWPCEGFEESVYVAGSFLAWAEIVPLKRTETGDFSVNCCFPVRSLTMSASSRGHFC